VIRGIETDKNNPHQPIEANSRNLTEKKDNHLLSVFIPLITVTPSPQIPPMHYPVKDKPTTPKQAS
jgi:hypothetical protein